MLRLIVTVMDETGELANWCLQSSEFDVTVVHGVVLNPETMDASFCLPEIGMDESSLEDDVPVLMITEGQTVQKSPNGGMFWHSSGLMRT